ncbi:MAG: chromate resistance protein [Rhodocyclaceae bacterium]|nr:chromate resistance protein [Rhodocyclaceae bacterium]
MNTWIMLITSLPTENATARMRAWRGLKASGAAVLRDGVYLMPERDACRATFETIASDLLAAGGTAMVLRVEEPEAGAFPPLFDRGEDYALLVANIARAKDGMTADSAPEILKQARKLRKTLNGISDTDFFPGEARRQAEAALQDLELTASRSLSPDEPHATEGTIPRLAREGYQGRTWATRKRLWVDRMASAWLIQHFIDPNARFIWLDEPRACPNEALGFDFDGAAFTHVAGRVTFEVLAASFGLEADRGIARLAAMVHFLDAGGVPVAEAPGVAAVLAGLRAAAADDDQLLTDAGRVFDGLYKNFQQESSDE